MAVPAGGSGTRAGPRGWIAARRAVWPADGGTAPAGRLTRAWSSAVETTAAAEPAAVRATVAEAGAGGRFVLLSSGGGRTQRYGGGGASPSKSGTPPSSPTRTDPHATTTSSVPAAAPQVQIAREGCRPAIRRPPLAPRPGAGPTTPAQHHEEDHGDH